MLPLRARLIHCRWSGESTWIPYGDLRPDVGWENHTSHPAPGPARAVPGRHQRVRDLLPVRRLHDVVQGRTAGCEPLRLHRARRRLGGPAARGRPPVPVGRARRRSRSPGADHGGPGRPRRHGRDGAAARGWPTWPWTAGGSRRSSRTWADSAAGRGRGRRRDAGSWSCPGSLTSTRTRASPRTTSRTGSSPIRSPPRSAARRPSSRSTTPERDRRRRPPGRCVTGLREWRAATDGDAAVDIALSLVVTAAARRTRSPSCPP